MRRAARIVAWIVSASIAALLLLAGLVFLGLDTAPGRRLVEELIPRLSGGEIAVHGLHGRLPREIAATSVELRDPGGVWARIGGLRIDWSPLDLLSGAVSVESATAARVRIIRLPANSANSGKSLRLRVERLRIDRLELAASLAGGAPAFAVRGRLRFDLPSTGIVHIEARELGGSGEFALSGDIDLPRWTADLDLSAKTSAMTPRPGLSWRSAALEAHVHGSLETPQGSGRLRIDGIGAGGGALQGLTAELKAADGTLAVTASAEGLRLPGPRPELFAAAPIVMHAEIRLDTPRHPLAFSLSHPLAALSGQADLQRGKLVGSLNATLPTLAPFAAASGLDLQGQAKLAADFSVAGGSARIAAGGSIGLTGGPAAVMRLFGDQLRLHAAAAIGDGGINLKRLAIAGKAFSGDASGSVRRDFLAFSWQLALPDLSPLRLGLSGALSAAGRLDGPASALVLSAEVKGKLGGAGIAELPLSASLRAGGLPAVPTARIAAEARLAGAPLQLAATAARSRDGTLSLSVEHVRWRSAEAAGELTLAPGASLPAGKLHITMARLDQLQPLIGARVTGSMEARLALLAAQGRGQAVLHADLRNLALDGNSVSQVRLGGTVENPLKNPTAALDLVLDGIKAQGVTGTVRLAARGPIATPAFRLSSDLLTAQGPAQLSAAGGAVLARRALDLDILRASYAGETARLLAPARLDLKAGLAVDRLRIGVGHATLALTARLAGSVERPTGTIRVTGQGLRLPSAAALAVPAAALAARVDLDGVAARLDAQLTAGARVSLRLAGTVPLRGNAPLDLRGGGKIDLAVSEPLLAAGGRRLRGDLTLDLGIAGIFAAPRLTGGARLARGDFEDFQLGTDIRDVTAAFAMDGDKLLIREFSGRAGPGRISLAGTIGVLAPGIPVDLTVSAEDARPLATDLLTADLGGRLTVTGKAIDGPLRIAGKIRVSRAQIHIPDSLPARVAVLNVERPGRKARAPSISGPRVDLALQIVAPNRVFVRGRGLDAELGGNLTLAGSIAEPVVSGGFELRHGNLSLAGRTLSLTSGKVAFNGTGLGRTLDPEIDFVAQGSSTSITASLEVKGYASTPKFILSSTPALPQDEVLAQLFFGQSVKQLSPFQLAALGQAVAAFGGLDADPLARIRNTLGLDELSVGAGSTGSGAAVTAGKYVAGDVYIGAKQNTSGGTQAQVRIDLTKHLKLQSTLGTSRAVPTGPITPQNDPGSSLGLSYEFEY